MALLNGLPEEYNSQTSALDAIDEDETKLKFEFIKSRVIEEEQRIVMRSKLAQENPKLRLLLPPVKVTAVAMLDVSTDLRTTAASVNVRAITSLDVGQTFLT